MPVPCPCRGRLMSRVSARRQQQRGSPGPCSSQAAARLCAAFPATCGSRAEGFSVGIWCKNHQRACQLTLGHGFWCCPGPTPRAISPSLTAVAGGGAGGLAGRPHMCVQVRAEPRRARRHAHARPAAAPAHRARGTVLQGAPRAAPRWQPAWAGGGDKWEFVVNRPGCQQRAGELFQARRRQELKGAGSGLAPLPCSCPARQPAPGHPACPAQPGLPTLPCLACPPGLKAAVLPPGVPTAACRHARGLALRSRGHAQAMFRSSEPPRGSPGLQQAGGASLQGQVSTLPPHAA